MEGSAKTAARALDAIDEADNAIEELRGYVYAVNASLLTMREHGDPSEDFYDGVTTMLDHVGRSIVARMEEAMNTMARALGNDYVSPRP